MTRRTGIVGLAMSSTGHAPTTIGYAGLALRTGLSLRQLKRLVAARKIPHIRYSERVVRFNRDEIEDWIQARHVRPDKRGDGE